jgi:hypothetical protein
VSGVCLLRGAAEAAADPIFAAIEAHSAASANLDAQVGFHSVLTNCPEICGKNQYLARKYCQVVRAVRIGRASTEGGARPSEPRVYRDI